MMKPVLERDVRRRFLRRLKPYGFLAIKLTSLGARGTAGWPDYLVIGRKTRLAFIELKRPGAAVTALQNERFADLNRAGYPVEIYYGEDNREFQWLLDWLNGANA